VAGEGRRVLGSGAHHPSLLPPPPPHLPQLSFYRFMHHVHVIVDSVYECPLLLMTVCRLPSIVAGVVGTGGGLSLETNSPQVAEVALAQSAWAMGEAAARSCSHQIYLQCALIARPGEDTVHVAVSHGRWVRYLTLAGSSFADQARHAASLGAAVAAASAAAYDTTDAWAQPRL
jgi:hypothetical protein